MRDLVGVRADAGDSPGSNTYVEVTQVYPMRAKVVGQSHYPVTHKPNERLNPAVERIASRAPATLLSMYQLQVWAPGENVVP